MSGRISSSDGFEFFAIVTFVLLDKLLPVLGRQKWLRRGRFGERWNGIDVELPIMRMLFTKRASALDVPAFIAKDGDNNLRRGEQLFQRELAAEPADK